MTKITTLTGIVGVMNGYSDEAGYTIKGNHIGKWFLITTPLVGVALWPDVKTSVQTPPARFASLILCSILANGLAYCVGSKFGRIGYEFHNGFKDVRPLRQPLPLLPQPLLRPPVTWTPSTASPAVSPDLQKGSSYTPNETQPQMQ